MLIDDHLPSYEFSERHEREIAAPAPDVYAALRHGDLGRSWIIGSLLMLRAIPGLVFEPRRTLERLRRMSGRPKLTLDVLIEEGFLVLGEDPGSEIVLGLAGRFWTPTGGLVRLTAEEFRRPLAPGLAQAVWNFRLEPRGARTRVVTETRIHCTDEHSRRVFGRYWSVVQPFSGIIRNEMLRSIARTAE